ncbi:MAG: arginine--tRNA ligase [Candidatus Westeberhardia cardiocondylae]|nr:arginine--tRNA ligase [Candidatus Westeberhardia cardiocondylae]
MNIRNILSKEFYRALFIVTNSSINTNLKIRSSLKSKFGDYQISGMMNIANNLGISSLILAKKTVEVVNLQEVASKIQVVPPGFINIFLRSSWLSKNLINILHSSRLGVLVCEKKTIIVDYSSPNIAKRMHVGHMRSTIIGDAFVRISEFLGHNVIRLNHIGDWGLQFGMLIAYLQDMKINILNITWTHLEIYYHLARKKYKKDLFFAKFVNRCVVKLQQGDLRCRSIWKHLVHLSILENQKIYNFLNITLKKSDTVGESAYNDMLPHIVQDLQKKGLAFDNHGTIIVFLDMFKNKQGKSMGVVIRKKNGAYLYSSTDIAAVKYRCDVLKADRIVYYIDFRQTQYLTQIWEIARQAGYVPNSVSLEHHVFGMIFGKDGKPFKTRSGSTIKLIFLLQEAVKRAKKLILSRRLNLSKKEVTVLSKIIAIGAVKYYELSKNRTINYVFDWDKILNFNGNTALYIQYSYTRIVSILQKYSQKYQSFTFLQVILKTKQELQLAIHLLKFEEVICMVFREGIPHVLCNYLYELSVLFSIFYENSPVLHVKNDDVRKTRILLLLLISKTLKTGLNLLGIEVIDKM